jgi:hypothetical protein
LPLRIAFDVDGVFADMESELVRRAEGLFGSRVTVSSQATSSPLGSSTPADDALPENARTFQSHRPLTRLRLSARQQRRLWRYVASVPRFWESLDEIEPGAVAMLASIAALHRWEVIFLTQRSDSAGPPVQRQTQQWLESRGFRLPSVIVVRGSSRGKIAAALGVDYVVDDRPENCLDVVVDSKARPILIWREDGRLGTAARRLEIRVVRSTKASLSILAEIEDPAHWQTAAFDRVKHLLGFRSSAQISRRA